ncbi:hypothetical protein GOODEAATRI_007191, partial [Goodea atripinnis]
VLDSGGQHMLVAFGWLLLFGTRSGSDQACSPPIGNLASGRVLLTWPNCSINDNINQSLCPNAPETPHSYQEDTHPSSLMTDDPFLHPDTWWASGGGHKEQDEIRLDLETKFCLSHVVLVFRSPRPAAMVIERSADFGITWEALRVFAHNCRVEFNLDDDLNRPGSLCTSRYSSPQPCSGISGGVCNDCQHNTEGRRCQRCRHGYHRHPSKPLRSPHACTRKMIKASVLSAHDKGSHAEVQVKVRKVLRSGQVALHLGTVSMYPLSWTSRGCTCPVLNPGMKYLLGGPQEPGTGRLLVTMQSLVVPWTPRLSLLLSEGLRNGCL